MGQPHRSFSLLLSGHAQSSSAPHPWGQKKRGAYVGLSWKPILNKSGRGSSATRHSFPGTGRLAPKSPAQPKPSSCVVLRSPQVSLFWCHALGSAWYQNSAQCKEDIHSSCLLFQCQPSSYTTMQGIKPGRSQGELLHYPRGRGG